MRRTGRLLRGMPGIVVHEMRKPDVAALRSSYRSPPWFDLPDGVAVATLLGGTVVATVHTGACDAMELAYEVLTAWIKEHGVGPSGTRITRCRC